MNLSQKFKKKLLRGIVIWFLLFSFSLIANEEIKIVIYPVKGSFDISDGDVKQIGKVVANSFCDIGASVWVCLNRDEGFKVAFDEVKLGQQGVTQEAIKLGKAKGANFALIATIGKLSSGSFTLNTQLIHLESTAQFPVGISELTPTIDGLFIYAKNQLGPDLVKKFQSMAGKTETATTCQDMTGEAIGDKVGNCLINNQTNGKSGQCVGLELQNSCKKINSDTSCVERCVVNALTVTKEAVALILAQQECEEKGKTFKDGKCIDSPAKPVTPVKPVTPYPSSSVSSSSVPNHDGSASWLIPGLGLVLKNRPIWGFLCFAATGWAVSDAYSKVQTYKHEKEEYRSVVPIPFPINLGFAGQFIYYDYRYKEFQQAAKEADTATDLAILIYSIQIAMSLTMSSDSHFLSSLGQENKKTLTYNFNVKRDLSFGVPNSNGALYIFSLNWRF